jgi:hypothetical protein
VDNATGQQLPLSFAATVPAGTSATKPMALSVFTQAVPILSNNLASLGAIATLLSPTGAPLQPGQFFNLLASVLSNNGVPSIPFNILPTNLTSADNLQLHVFDTSMLTTLEMASYYAASLQNASIPVSAQAVDQASQNVILAVVPAVTQNIASGFDLTSVPLITSLVTGAVQAPGSTVAAAAAPVASSAGNLVSALAGLINGRKLLQAAPASAPSSASTQDAIVQTIASVNQLVVGTLASTGTATGSAVQQQLAQIAGVVQSQIVPAIQPLVRGTISPANFIASFTGTALTTAVAAYKPPMTSVAAAPAVGK